MSGRTASNNLAPASVKAPKGSRMPDLLVRRPRALESSPIHEDMEAVEYEHMISRFAWLLNDPFVNLVSRVNLKHARVLDIGSGPGRIPVELAKRNPGWEIWGVDPSGGMLAKARTLAATHNVAERVHFKTGTAEQLPFEKSSFDLVISNFALHHVDKPEAMLNEALRVADTKGQLIIKDLARQPRWLASLLLLFSKRVLRYSAKQMDMYRESLDAGLTRRELREAVERSHITDARIRNFRIIDNLLTAVLKNN